MEYSESFSFRPLFADLEQELRTLRGKKICVLGVSGLFGNWLSEILLRLSDEYNLEIKVIGVARGETENKFVLTHRNFISCKINLLEPSASLPYFDYCFHAATSNDQRDFPPEFNSAVQGARLILDASRQYKNQPHVIHLSSGAVYHSSMVDNGSYPERAISFSSGNGTEYAKAKIRTEEVLEMAHRQNLITVCNPRLFAFVGPGIPLDKHFAIGNFMHSAINKSIIEVTGNPMTTRSYMYLPDAIRCLISLLISPIYSPLNIGSPRSITINDLAIEISRLFDLPFPNFMPNSSVSSHYVPTASHISKMLGNTRSVELEEALLKWFHWLTK